MSYPKNAYVGGYLACSARTISNYVPNHPELFDTKSYTLPVNYVNKKS